MSDCLSVADITHWVERLLANDAWGWTRDAKLLAHTLGFDGAWRMRKYLWGNWNMTVGHQQRVSAQLQLILSGEIVCERRLFGGGAHRKIASQAIHADHPTPLSEMGPATAVVSVGPHGVKLHVKPRLGQAAGVRAMPSFAEIWQTLR